MTQLAGVQSWFHGGMFLLVWAAVLHQSFASVAPLPSDPGRPERGTYSIKTSNGTVCLLAQMGLQLNISYSSVSQNKTVHDVMNIQPNITNSTGLCGGDSATLVITGGGDKLNLTFLFALNVTSLKYHLGGLFLSAEKPDMKEPFAAHNNNLDYLRGTLGRSYMCREEQTLNVDPSLTINTFQLQVQPFGATGDDFGEAEECQLDEDDMLIPIIVGAALAGLVLIVLMAYLIGRKRSHAGYQTI
ncbi:lysosome-associated membrane glycoprotein 1b [Genypterus blacodes]|uniref:lysosome-associated membrane glycoprotein 1b n=1 Tax=Genypterus blacodes TaxID=154954 RepID=UPI003F759768